MSAELSLGEFEEFVRGKVESGEYESREEVFREALSLLQQKDEAWKADARRKILEGLDSYHAGLGIPGKEAMAELRAEIEAMAPEAKE